MKIGARITHPYNSTMQTSLIVLHTFSLAACLEMAADATTDRDFQEKSHA